VTKRSPYALPEREPGAPYSPADMLRDKRAIVDTGLAPIVFIVANTIAGLNVAAIAAGVVAVGLMLERLLRRASPVNAVGGLIGTGIAVYIALRTGTPEGFFWPKVAQNAAYGVVFLISILIRRPLIGVIVQAIYQWPSGYTRDPRVRPAFSVASLAWVVLFGVRAVVYTVLILAGKAEWLGAVVLVLGWPAFAATIFFSYRYVTWWLQRTGAPDPDEYRAEQGEAPAAPPRPAPTQG
jgi:hypothetical protein